ncbi:SRPBCC family protein [Arthrobacter sp. 260]|uniref:SRPBCC family protein n=1 Tax=Arthrobacter sp. 260 TaxID=2735314 RepID=UPI0014915760|nr:SRPBCC family protein [Arthrobacter sp. 260]NOJ60188.1 SRPBCC family protein [Arthrobacter sp. 260]
MITSALPWLWIDPSPARVSGALASGAASRQCWVRAVDVASSPDLVFAWTTQLRRAPYSYDLIDNWGHRSPQVLDPALIDLRPGDTVMRIFTVVSVDPARSFTLRFSSARAERIFGRLIIEYLVEPVESSSRLVVRLSVPLPTGPLDGLRQSALAWGDLVMMRKQLRELRRLAERDHRSLTPPDSRPAGEQ